MNNEFSVYTRKEQKKAEFELNSFRSKANNFIYIFFGACLLFFGFSIFKFVSALVS